MPLPDFSATVRAGPSEREATVVWKPLQVALCVMLPLAWGLAVELLFELARRKRGRRERRQ